MLSALLYPVRQLHRVCRVYAEEDVQDFRQLRPSLDAPQALTDEFEVLCHRMERKLQIFVLDMQIYFAIPPN